MKYLTVALLVLVGNTAFAGPLTDRLQQQQQQIQQLQQQQNQNQNQSTDSTPVLYNTGPNAVVVPNGQGAHGSAYGHRGAYGASHRNANQSGHHRGNQGHRTSGKRERR